MMLQRAFMTSNNLSKPKKKVDEDDYAGQVKRLLQEPKSIWIRRA